MNYFLNVSERPLDLFYSDAVSTLHRFKQNNRTAAGVLLTAVGGDEQLAARTLALVGVQELNVLVESGNLASVVPLLMAQRRSATLSDPTTSGAAKTSAMGSLRRSAQAYDEVSTPPSGVTQTTGSGIKFRAKELYRKAVAAYNWPGQQVDAAWQKFVAAPTQAAAGKMYTKFQSTPVGEYWETQAVKGKAVLQKVTNENTPFGKLLNVMNQHVVQNDKLWSAVDKAGAVGRNVVLGSMGTTLAIIAYAYSTGKLKTGTFNSSDPKLTPEQLQMLKGVNIPPGMNVRFFSAPMTTPVEVNGKTFYVKSAATIVVGEGSNVLFLPASGPGKPGAQPWFGPTSDGGKTRNQPQIVAASSSVAAAHWDVIGFNIGTSNFNVGGRADLQFARGLLNIGAAQLYRKAPPAGEAKFNFKTVLISDLVSTFHSATINVGPVAVVVDRERNPQTERVTLPIVGKQDYPVGTFAGKAHGSKVQPAIPVMGASTWDPNQDDVRLINTVLGGGGGGGSAPTVPQKK